jgi:general secretion pathway protein E
LNVIAYISKLIETAIAHRASDIHLEPLLEGLRVRQRIDGLLVQTDLISPKYSAAIISRLKIMGQLDIGEKRLPQDGSFVFQKAQKRYDLRISTLPTRFGEKIVLRLFPDLSEHLSLQMLGMEKTDQLKLTRWLKGHSGLLIVTGPTGSGKTTTIYAILQLLNKENLNIVTLEDPIELQMNGINQVQIHPKAGFTFAEGLRAILRQDPNVIMIGEIRDLETADVALRAALTGHLVLTSMHTSDTAQAVMRLLQMNLEPNRLAAALKGLIAQRLIRLKCPSCYGQRCVKCQQTGFLGRTGVFEVVEVTETFRQLISEKATVTAFRQYLRREGIIPLAEAIYRKIRQGVTSKAEGERVMGVV